MGILTKTCSFCNATIFSLKSNYLKDGCYCKQCKTKLSPFFIHQKTYTINDIRKQLECRKRNEQLFVLFNPTKTIGDYPRLQIDEINHQFAVVLTSHGTGMSTPDVIDFSQLTDCSVDIVEEKHEVKYKDFSDNLKSFSPPYYAYAYDFYINISVSVPYIQTIRIKVNATPIDNDQPHVIEKTGGLTQMFRDAIGSARSFNGRTSNATEVQTSSTYLKYEKLANEMRNALWEAKTSMLKNKTVAHCPWCGSLNIDNSNGTCVNCCGPLSK